MSEAATPIRIDFVSDVSCPWCAIGLQALEQAIARVGDDARVELHFQPFELNPALAAEGEDAIEHLVAKYGISETQAKENGEAIRARGAELGFTFDMDRRRHVWNTFDAHRLLHWAELEALEKQRALKHALLRAYFTDGENVSDHDVLARLAESAGLDGARARQVLASDEFADALALFTAPVRLLEIEKADHSLKPDRSGVGDLTAEAVTEWLLPLATERSTDR